jgi:hypothetical protein
MYESILKPWELSHDCHIVSKLMFTPSESYAEMFAFQHFPYFINLFKEEI